MVVSLAAALAASGQLTADSLFWDANADATTATGGAGTWDTGSALWRNGTSTGSLQTWTNTDPNGDIAVFGGTAGTVTLNDGSVDIFANQLQFTTTGYSINGPAAGTAELILSGTTPTVSVNSSVSATINAILSGGSLSKDGAGVLTLTGANIYTGVTTVLNGTLSLSGASPGGTLGIGSSSIILGHTSGANNTTLRIAGPAHASLARNIVIQAGNTGTAMITTTTSSFQIGTFSGNITLGSGGTGKGLTLSANQYTTTDITGVIQDPDSLVGTAGAVTIAGGTVGTVRLRNANTFSGGLIVNGGVRFFDSSAAGTGTITINGGSIGANGGSITLNNNAQIWNGNFSVAGASGTLSTGTGSVSLTGTRTIGITNAHFIVGGVIDDGAETHGIILNHGQYTSSVTLRGANTFGGGVTLGVNHVEGTGILGIGNLGTTSSASALGTGTFTIAAGVGTARFNNNSGAAGTLSTNNDQTWNRSFTFVGTHSLNMGTGVVILGDNVVATVSENTLTIGGSIGDGGSDFVLSKAGAGVLELTGANTFGGGVNVNAGQLLVTGLGNLGLGNVNVNAGTLALNNSAAIADTALFTIETGGIASLGDGVNDLVGGLVLGGVTFTDLGTYGSTASGAMFAFDDFFTGTGMVTLVPEPGAGALLGLGALALILRRRRARTLN